MSDGAGSRRERSSRRCLTVTAVVVVLLGQTWWAPGAAGIAVAGARADRVADSSATAPAAGRAGRAATERVGRPAGGSALRSAGPPSARLSARLSARSQPAGGRLPVTIDIQQLEPREVRSDSVLTVVAKLTNKGQNDSGPLQVLLRRGSLITTRSELAIADQTPPPTLIATAPPSLPYGSLSPGQSMKVTYRCPAKALRLGGLGVYPISFQVQATTAAGTLDTVGEVRTVLPFFPETIQAKPTRVAWLWPLLDRPHRLTSDGGTPLLADDQLARSVAHGGRLDRLLDAAEQVTGLVQLTLVVDPETIEALARMARDYQRSGTRTSPGNGGPAAADWLERLRIVARHHTVAAVPYADPDIVALHRGGVEETLYRQGPDAVDRELGQPVAPLAWPPGGLLTNGALDQLVSQGIQAVVLDSAALPRGLTQATPTPSAVSSLPGQAVALVTDATLQGLVAQSTSYPGGARLAEQRYLAELAMLTAQRPDDQRTYVITPPRRWAPSASYAIAVLRDAGTVSWLTSVTVPAVVGSTQAVDRGPLSYPAGAQRSELPAVQVQRIAEAAARVSDFRSALTYEGANKLLPDFDDALRRACSSAWRDDRRTGQAYTRSLWNSISSLRSRVTVARPTTGIYSLTSSDSPLSLTVRNDLRTTVTVRLKIDTSNAPGFEVQDIGSQQIRAGARLTVRVPATVQRSGTFLIRVQLVTPHGGTLGTRITLTVRSTAYGAVALGITGAALVVLMAAVAVRFVRRRVRAREVTRPGSPADRSRR